MQEKSLNVVLCWHMHQPQYKSEGVYMRPWTWLHAIKDYSDMATHIEALPGARAVVNFSPHLMVQIDDYANRIQCFLESGAGIGDPILDTLGSTLPAAHEERKSLLRSCLRSHEVNIRQRFGPYDRLCDQAEQALQEDSLPPEQECLDLVTWYCLAWMGEFARNESAHIRHLVTQKSEFSLPDRLDLLGVIGDLITGILPRYRRLAEQGKVELSVTPWSHPILPLLMDFGTAHEAMPGVAVPGDSYPGGAARCDWQLDRAIEYFESHFGFRPAGCWPSEGAISEGTLDKLRQHSFEWTGSGTNVLRNSLGEEYSNGNNQHQIWSVASASDDHDGIACVFRDDELSDLIGFSYSNWQPADAVNNLVHRLEMILEHCAAENPTVSIIMDGENAWEYYPENGREFLSTLYARLANHPRFNLSTFSDLLSHTPLKPLPRLTAGSWVYGNFEVWIGHPAKNRAWELLIDAKKAVDKELASADQGQLPVDLILEQLSVCESSDWFWWLGEEGRAQDGPAFDELFRTQLKALYRLIGLSSPVNLDHAIDDTHTAKPALTEDGPAAGTMRQANPKDFP